MGEFASYFLYEKGMLYNLKVIGLSTNNNNTTRNRLQLRSSFTRRVTTPHYVAEHTKHHYACSNEETLPQDLLIILKHSFQNY